MITLTCKSGTTDFGLRYIEVRFGSKGNFICDTLEFTGLDGHMQPVSSRANCTVAGLKCMLFSTRKLSIFLCLIHSLIQSSAWISSSASWEIFSLDVETSFATGAISIVVKSKGSKRAGEMAPTVAAMKSFFLHKSVRSSLPVSLNKISKTQHLGAQTWEKQKTWMQNDEKVRATLSSCTSSRITNEICLVTYYWGLNFVRFQATLTAIGQFLGVCQLCRLGRARFNDSLVVEKQIFQASSLLSWPLLLLRWTQSVLAAMFKSAETSNLVPVVVNQALHPSPFKPYSKVIITTQLHTTNILNGYPNRRRSVMKDNIGDAIYDCCAAVQTLKGLRSTDVRSHLDLVLRLGFHWVLCQRWVGKNITGTGLVANSSKQLLPLTLHVVKISYPMPISIQLICSAQTSWPGRLNSKRPPWNSYVPLDLSLVSSHPRIIWETTICFIWHTNQCVSSIPF